MFFTLSEFQKKMFELTLFRYYCFSMCINLWRVEEETWKSFDLR